jgi:uncharacterized membrane protein YeiH
VPAPSTPFQLPIGFDLAATFLFAVTGAVAGIQKRYDLVGATALALVAGLGGALLRDGLFLQAGPPAVIHDGRYLVAVLAGAAAGVFFARHVHRLRLLFTVADALGLGIYAVVGAQKSLDAQLPLVWVTLVGVANAVGGSLARDVLVREEPLMFKPGELYALAALLGSVVFVLLVGELGLGRSTSALAAIAAAFAARVLSIGLGWRTEPLRGHDARG